MKEQYAKKQATLKEALKLVPFEGWTPKTMAEAAQKAGFPPEYAEILFPAGLSELVSFFIAESDRNMLEALKTLPLDTMKVRERIATAVKTRIMQHLPHRAAIAPTLRFFALPQHAALGATLLGQTCSEIWYAAGDTATDFNYYSKRFLLAGVYSSTLLYWLDDHSEGFEETWAFLDRRINNVLALGGIGRKCRENLGKFWPKVA